MAAKKSGTGSIEQQLEAAKKKVVELEKDLAACRDECEFVHKNNAGFLVAFLDDELKAKAVASDLIASKTDDATAYAAAIAAANAWRQASEMLREFALSEYSSAQKIRADVGDTGKKPALHSHRLLIAALVELIADARGRSTNTRGLQAEINADIREKHRNVLGLGETKIQQMFAEANKAAGNNGFNLS